MNSKNRDEKVEKIEKDEENKKDKENEKIEESNSSLNYSSNSSLNSSSNYSPKSFFVKYLKEKRGVASLFVLFVLLPPARRSSLSRGAVPRLVFICYCR